MTRKIALGIEKDLELLLKSMHEKDYNNRKLKQDKLIKKITTETKTRTKKKKVIIKAIAESSLSILKKRSA